MTTVVVHAGYVNASHVCFSDSPNQLIFNYIAAQGPLNGTVDEFWRMCLEQVGGRRCGGRCEDGAGVQGGREGDS